MKYNYVADYKLSDELRRSFNDLTEKTFSFRFDTWYEKGFWGEKYIPHFLEDNGKVIANVSVNLMDFYMDGVKKHFIQLGTVMTDRGQGLIRYIMERILEEYKDKTDGIYLFGNDSVLDFYPKFGFKKSEEYEYSKCVDSSNYKKTVELVTLADLERQNHFFGLAKQDIYNGRFIMDNIGILAFYTVAIDSSVYYLKEENAYIIAEIDKDILYLQQIISDHLVNLDVVISSFGSEFHQVVLGFTPLERGGYEIKERKEEDTTLFIMGEDLREIAKKQLMFPVLSHA